ncbi:MarR family transcriptional regulator [Comamonas serinivorans]|uniref:MarR family transcriptional regulator n=1 Tax=Comamonas serinivorans TaxID=1082851 RepID=A0A1Y0ELS9_9BURK|nr:MarR family winged helix-turn-helix transcriptional regulator [Comamonas serinivorans]ARU04370.1 MarR family transcriptional regulator [Comamonas serinivorans]
MDTVIRPQGCTHFKLRQLARVVTRRYDAELAQAGLKTSQYSLLTHVLRLGPLRPVDLAREMELTPSTLTRNLQPMVAAGWLELTEGADARSRLVRITEAGRDKRSEAQRRWRAAQEALNAELGVQRVAALHALIDECMGRIAGPQGERHAR